MKRVAGAAALTFLLVGGVTWLVVWPVPEAAGPGPAFPDRWTDGATAPVGLEGTWDAWITDEPGEARLNPCRLRFRAASDGGVLVRSESVEPGWTCWGRGRLDGRTIRFEWTGPKGWHGTCELTLSADGRTLMGTFRRDGVGDVERAIATRPQTSNVER